MPTLMVQRKHPISPFILVASVSLVIFKASLITWRMWNVGSPVGIFLSLIASDLSYLSIFIGGVFLQSSDFPKIVRWLLESVLAVCLFWYGLDLLIIYLLGGRASVTDLFSYASEAGRVGEVRDLALLLALYVCLAGSVRPKISLPCFAS